MVTSAGQVSVKFHTIWYRQRWLRCTADNPCPTPNRLLHTNDRPVLSPLSQPSVSQPPFQGVKLVYGASDRHTLVLSTPLTIVPLSNQHQGPSIFEGNLNHVSHHLYPYPHTFDQQ